jgi:uncharacterized protein YneF (UPF0154 family)
MNRTPDAVKVVVLWSAVSLAIGVAIGAFLAARPV